MNFHKGIQLDLYSNDSIIKNLTSKSELQKKNQTIPFDFSRRK